MPIETQTQHISTNPYAVKKLEQNEQNGNAVYIYYSKKKLERYVNHKCNGTKFTEASKKIKNEIHEPCIKHATWDSTST